MQTVKCLVAMLALALVGCSEPVVEYVAVSGQAGAGSLLKLTGNRGEMQILTVSGTVERSIPLVDVDFNDPLQAVPSHSGPMSVTIKETKQKLSFAELSGAIVCLHCGHLGLPVNWVRKKTVK